MTSPCLKMGQIFNRRNFVNIWARKPNISAEHKACPWLSWLCLQIPVPLSGKKFAPPPKWQPFLKFRSFHDSPNLNTYLETTRWDGKKWCVIHEIISKSHWAASMWSYPYMFLYKALVFQTNFWTVVCLQVAISRKRMIEEQPKFVKEWSMTWQLEV